MRKPIVVRASLAAVSVVALLVAAMIAPSAAVTGAATVDSGKWATNLLITANRIGDVRVGMSPRQASQAAGAELKDIGDSIYTSPRAPGLEYERGGTCLSAFGPASVHTATGITRGSSLRQLRAVYGRALHYYNPGQGGFRDPRSYFIHNQQGYMFFHLTHVRSGTIRWISIGNRRPAAYC